MTATDHRQPAPAPGLAARLLMLGVSVAVAFAIAEIAARALYPAPPTPDREPALVFETHPTIGFRPVANQQGWLDDGLASINTLGLRGRLPSQAPGVTRILAVGDSTTFGWGVNDDETYPAHLESELTAQHTGRTIEVVNGGVSGHDLTNVAGMLLDVGPKLRPRLVLVGVFWNDLPYQAVAPDGVPPGPATAGSSDASEASESGRSFRLANRPPRATRWLRRSRLIFALRHATVGLWSRDAEVMRQIAWEDALRDGRDTPAIRWAWTEVDRALAEIKRIATEAGARMAIVAIPMRVQVEDPAAGTGFQSRIAEAGATLGVPVLDPLADLRADDAPSTLFIPYDRMHFSARGNAIVGRSIAAQVGALLPAEGGS